MDSHSNKSYRGHDIVPKARRSIHSTNNTYQTHKTMGRYGLKTDLNLPETGTDEVDNVMRQTSKVFNVVSRIYPISSKMPGTKRTPIQLRKKPRRNSVPVCDETEDDDDDSDENVLSKSCPSQLSYSVGFDSAIENISERNLNNDSSTSRYHFIQSSPNHKNNGARRLSSQLQKDKGFSQLNYLFVPVVISLVGVFFYIQLSESQEENIYDKQHFYNDVKILGTKYRVPDDSILKVKTGITTISNNEDTGSFIFTYNSENSKFNLQEFDEFIEDISAKASKYLRNDTKLHHFVINPKNLIMQTEKEFMNHYLEDVFKRGVMLIKDVDNIPSYLAMAFHYYCDEYNPLVKKSAIFFTLNLAKCTNGSERKSTHEYIEKCLAKKWNSIEQDKIGPLLTRVVNIVVDATNIL